MHKIFKFIQQLGNIIIVVYIFSVWVAVVSSSCITSNFFHILSQILEKIVHIKTWVEKWENKK